MVQFFKNERAIQSLRESDFDAVSAYGEVIDNAIQADAGRVQIRFATEPPKHGYSHIEYVAFGDDGHGMDAQTLHNCLTVGWSSRYNDRDGIGRFGVGMTMAAIHECKRVEVWSKVAGGDWLWTYMDLDEIEEGALAEIPQPESKAPPGDLADLAGGKSGTLVVWRKYDRQDENATEIIKDLRVWAGRTYRYYLWDAIPPRTGPVEIFIDGENVPAIDPLYARPELSRFPNDPAAEVYPDIEFEWPVDQSQAAEAGHTETISIRLSKLPVEFREKEGAGGDKQAMDRYIDQNEGLSILRNHREVFYGEIPYWKVGGKGWPQFEAIDRWWGCEIHFGAELDRAFQVKNIKRGAVPTRKLKVTIKDKILPTRNTVLEDVRRVWAEEKQRRKEEEARELEEATLTRSGDHHEAETVAKKTPTDKTKIDEGKDLDQEAHKQAENYSDRFDKEQRSELEALFKSQPFTIMEETWRGPQFFESSFLGGNALLQYNMSHELFGWVYGLIDELDEDGVDSEGIARELRVVLDLLIIAYAKAEASFSPDVEYPAEHFIETLRSNWGQYLSNYVRTRRKQRGSSEDAL